MSPFLLDLKQALRRLLRAPDFALLAILSLALGIGVNSAVFTVIDHALLRPLPVPEPSRLARVYPGPRGDSFPVPVFRDLARDQSVMDLAAEGFTSLSWTRGDQSQQVTGSLVSGSYFPVLGVKASLGRLLGPRDDQTPGGSPVAVLNSAFWKNRLGGDPSIVGRPLTLNGHTFTVVGIAAPSFSGDYTGIVPDIWVPLSMQAWARPDPKYDLLQSRNTSWIQLLGRLHQGTGQAQAQQALQALEPSVFQPAREPREGHIQLTAMSVLPRDIERILKPVLFALQAVVLLVLLIACSNVANLQLARALARRHEVAMRISLGASRVQLVRQFLTESALLSLLGAAGGLGLGAMAMRAVPSLIPPISGPALVFDLGMDWRVVAFAVLISLGTGLIFGLAPALQATRIDPASVLKEESAGLTVRTGLTRRLFVVAQVALSLVLLVASGLFIRSLGKAKGINPGFERSRMLLFKLDPGSMGYTPERSAALYEDLRQSIAAQPGVRGVSMALNIPLSGDRISTSYQIQGQELPKDSPEPEAGFNEVGLDYFKTMGIPLISGRDFQPSDKQGAPLVAIANATFVREALGGRFEGRRLLMDKDVVEIVGVVRDVKTNSLGESAAPMLYLPLSQNPASSLSFAVATTGDPAPLLGRMREVVRQADPYLPVTELRTMDQHLRYALFPARTGALLLGVFGLMALFLATAGVYGVMAYDAAQRRHEIGIRMALGAQIMDIVRLIVSQGMRVICIGLGIGLVLAWGLSRLLSSLLYGINAADPLTFGAITGLLGGVALLACLLPALRAARVDPMAALRHE
jgi:predicted permease